MRFARHMLRGVRLFIAFGLLSVAWLSPMAIAAFSATATSGITLAADTLNGPTGVAAMGGCNLLLSWTATVDTYATGYRVLRATASGGPYTEIQQVTPRTAASTTDSPSTGTYYYVLKSYYENWESSQTNAVSATVTVLPTTQATSFNFSYSPNPITIGSGCSIQWTNTSRTQHTVTSDTNIWAATLNYNQTFTRQFNVSGTFPYHCQIHPQMVGTVIVN